MERHQAYGLLQLLEPAYSPWQSIAMDFIPYLPLRKGCDQLWVIIDRYTKMAYFIPLKKKNNKAEDLATIFTTEIWRLHGIPGEIMSDRDPRFISKFWKSLIPILGLRLRMSIPFYPQMTVKPSILIRRSKHFSDIS
jgi:transposase InsO family protein